MADNNFNTEKLIAALRAKGATDEEIEKLYGPILGDKKNQHHQDEKPKREKKKTQQKTRKPRKWTAKDLERLQRLFANGYGIEDLIKEFNTTAEDIVAQLENIKTTTTDGHIRPEFRDINVRRRFEGLRKAGRGIKKGAGFLNERFGSHAAANIEKNFGIFGRGFNKLTGLGYSNIDEDKLKEKLGGNKSGNASVEAINKTGQIIVESLASLNHAISHSTTLLARSIRKATSKVMERVANIESTIKKYKFAHAVRQRREDLTSGLAGGGKSFGKLALMGGIALATGMALNSLLSDDKDHESTGGSDAAKKPETKKQEQVLQNKQNGSEELRIHAKELKFNAKNVLFEYDELKFDQRSESSTTETEPPDEEKDQQQNNQTENPAQNNSTQTPNNTNSQPNQITTEPNQKANQITPETKDSVFGDPDRTNPKTELGGLNEKPPLWSKTDDWSGDPNNKSGIKPNDLSETFAGSPSNVREGMAQHFRVSKNKIPDWLASISGSQREIHKMGGGGATLSGKEFSPQAKELYNRLLDKNDQDFGKFNFTKAEAAGIISNLINESGPNIHPGLKGDKGSAHGVMQWREKRWANVLKYAQERGLDPYDRKTQYSAMAHEWQNDPYEKQQFEKFRKASDDPRSKSGAFNRYVERSDQRNASHRMQDATRIDQSSVDKPPTEMFKPQAPIPYQNSVEQYQRIAPVINNGAKLNSLKVDSDAQETAPKKQQSPTSNHTEANPLDVPDIYQTMSQNVLETQGPNHFDEAGFPSGNQGILA